MVPGDCKDDAAMNSLEKHWNMTVAKEARDEKEEQTLGITRTIIIAEASPKHVMTRNECQESITVQKINAKCAWAGDPLPTLL